MIEIRHENMQNTIDTKNAYNSIYNNEGIQLKDSFYIWITRLLHISEDKHILDVSCGYGKLIYFASKMTKNAYGIDFSQSAIQKAAKRYPSSKWQIGDGEQLPFAASSFDIITNIGSLEHFQNPESGIKEISRVLKTNGIACILLPNAFSILGNVKNVLFKGDVFDDGQPLQRYNTKLGWNKLLSENGLKPIKIIRYERIWPRTFDDFIWYLKRPFKFIHLLVGYVLPTNLINCFVYICIKHDN